PLNLLLVLLPIVAFVTWRLWHSFIRIYSKAQVALRETFASPPQPTSSNSHTALQSFLHDAELEKLKLAADSPAAGKLICELQLRTRTGASIVAIERGGQKIINPGPDDELRPGDEILILGTQGQLQAAKAAFSSLAPAS